MRLLCSLHQALFNHEVSPRWLRSLVLRDVIRRSLPMDYIIVVLLAHDLTGENLSERKITLCLICTEKLKAIQNVIVNRVSLVHKVLESRQFTERCASITPVVCRRNNGCRWWHNLHGPMSSIGWPHGSKPHDLQARSLSSTHKFQGIRKIHRVKCSNIPGGWSKNSCIRLEGLPTSMVILTNRGLYW